MSVIELKEYKYGSMVKKLEEEEDCPKMLLTIVNFSFTIYPKLVAQGNLLNKKLTVKTPAGTYTGVSGEGIFLPNVYSDTGYPVFVPKTYPASVTVTSAEDNYYMEANYTINF